MNELTISDDGFTEIIGGAPILTPDLAYDVLGDLVGRSAPFKAYVEKRVAASRPVIHRVPLIKARQWQVDFTGPFGVFGTAGSQTTLVANPQCLFRGEKVTAVDTGSPNQTVSYGYGTAISQIFVGQKSQRPANNGATLTAFFAQNVLGNGIRWDTCQKGLLIAMTVNFLNDCTFFCTVYGSAVVD